MFPKVKNSYFVTMSLEPAGLSSEYITEDISPSPKNNQ